MTDDKQHAHLGASNSAIWLNCHHAGRHMRDIKGASGPSKFAAEGTLAHTLGELGIMFGMDTVRDRYLGETVTVHGMPFDITESMLDHVQTYVNHVHGISHEQEYPEEVFPDGSRLLLEERVSLDQLYADHVDGHNLKTVEPLFGTADAVVVSHAFSGTLYIDIVDLKFGAGVPVEADTPQGKYYALGTLFDVMQNTKRWIRKAVVRMVIVQPRAPHPDGKVRGVVYTDKDLMAFGKDVMDAVTAIHGPNPKFQSGKWCRFCPLAGSCPELFKQNLALARGAFATIPVPQTYPKSVGQNVQDGNVPLIEPNRLTNAELAFVLDRKDILKKWLDAVEQEAMKRLWDNSSVPGWKLVPKRARRVWGPSAGFGSLDAAIGAAADLLTEEILVSPAVAEKKLSKEDYQILVDSGLVVKALHGVTLADASDRRPAVDVTAAARDEFDVYDDTTEENP